MILVNPMTRQTLNVNPEGCNQYSGKECVRAKKIDKFKGHVKKLSERFKVSVPELSFSTGLQAGTRGTYQAGSRHRMPIKDPVTGARTTKEVVLPPRILMGPHMSLETLAHEFAHHLSHEYGMRHPDPEKNHNLQFDFLLKTLRREIGGKEFDRLMLEGSALKKLPREWQ